MTFFTSGVWLEAEGIFGVVDDLGVLYLVEKKWRVISKENI
jgi:neuroblastoma-amplified sequence